MSNTSYKPDSLLPRIYEKELHALDVAQGVQTEKLRLELQTIATLGDPNRCPVEFLPLLAFAFGSDFYWELEDLEEYQQREMILNSLQLHRHKGTRWAVEKVLSILGVETEIMEWWEDIDDSLSIKPTEPYTFMVVANVSKLFNMTEKALGLKEQKRLLKYIDVYKNIRSHYEMYLKTHHNQGISLPMLIGVNDVFVEHMESDDFSKKIENKIAVGSDMKMLDTVVFPMQTNDYSIKAEDRVNTIMKIEVSEVIICG